MKNIITRLFTITALAVWLQIPNSIAATDTTPPSVPINLAVNGLSTTQIKLAWNASTDNVGVAGYNVYRNGTLINTTNVDAYTDSSITPLTTYTYSISAYDAAGNTSAMSASITIGGTPTPLNLAVKSVSPTQINLIWFAPANYEGIAGYNVYRNGTKINTTTSCSGSPAATMCSTTDSSITPSTDYIYSVSAYDWSGNTSAMSVSIAAGNPMFTSTNVTPTTSLTTPLTLSAQGEKYWFWPNQSSTTGWIPTNDIIENTFANLNLWPTLQGHLLANQGGFGLWAPMIGSTSNQTLTNFRSLGLPVTVGVPGMTQCGVLTSTGFNIATAGTDIANAELNGTGPWASTAQFIPFNLVVTKGWFMTKQGGPYTPDEIDYDERMLSLMPYYNATILGDPNQGSWAQRKQAALINSCGLYGVDPTGMYNTPPATVTNIMNNYVQYSQAIKAKWPTNTPKISMEWQVTYGIATESSACIETLNSLYPNAGTFAYELAHSENIPSCMVGTNLLSQLLKIMQASGTLPDTVYMDIAFGEAAQNAANDQDYILAALNANKTLLAQYGVNFGVNLPGGTCHIIEPEEAAYTANPAIYPTGVSLNTLDSKSLLLTTNNNTANTINPQCQTTSLSEYNWLLNNGILDANTRIHYISWTMAPEENGTSTGPSISENTPYSFANTVNQMFPTASLTINGSNSATIGIGYTANFVWSSTNAITASSTYTTDSPACGAASNGPFPWRANTLSGSLTSSQTSACQAGHTYTITYTATNSIGQSTSSIIKETVSAPIANSFTVTGCTASVVGGKCGVSLNWSTNYTNYNGAPMTVVNVGDFSNPAGWYGGSPVAGVSYYQAAQANVSTSFQLPVGNYWFQLMGYNNSTWVPLATSQLVQISNPPPTATLTINGTNSATIGIGYTANFAWNSTNAATASSTYTTDSLACGAASNGPFPWSANTLSGSLTSSQTSACQAGHTYTITYTSTNSTNSTGQSSSSTITMKVSGPVVNSFTATGCTASVAGGKCSVVVSWTTNYTNLNGAPMTVVNVGDLSNPAGWYGGSPVAGVSYYQAAANNVTTTFQLPKGTYYFGLEGYNNSTWVPLATSQVVQVTD